MDEKKCEQLWVAATEGNLSVVQELSQDPSVDINWQDGEFRRTPLCRASGRGRTEVVRFLLGLPNLQADLTQITGGTPFNIACQQGHADVVSLLLADPRVDVNKSQQDGLSPFCKACQDGHVEVVSLLLADPRVDVNKATNNDTTPLWFASQEGYVSVVQLMLASGREVATTKGSKFNNSTAGEQAKAIARRLAPAPSESEEEWRKRKGNCQSVADLLEAFEKTPAETRARLRKELGIDKSLAGELFALVVYLSDEYLQIPKRNRKKKKEKEKDHEDEKELEKVLEDGNEKEARREKEKEKEKKAQKFFSIALQLPMEVQMVLCNRVFHVAGSLVRVRDSERGFLKFARGF